MAADIVSGLLYVMGIGIPVAVVSYVVFERLIKSEKARALVYLVILIICLGAGVVLGYLVGMLLIFLLTKVHPPLKSMLTGK